jgi:tetratricopeptide (TPR) repeat protein
MNVSAEQQSKFWTYALALIAAISAYAALAQPLLGQSNEPPLYRAAIHEALTEYDAGRHVEARALFAEAHRLFPNARTLRGLGMAAYELRDYCESILRLEEALSDSVRPLERELRDQTATLIAKSRRFVASVDLELTPSAARVWVDEEPEPRPSGGRLLLSVGMHQIHVRAPSYATQNRDIRVQGGELERWVIALRRESRIEASTRGAVVEARPIKGNLSRGKKLYHLPRCPGYESTTIDVARGERWFTSENEARAAGFRRAENCR